MIPDADTEPAIYKESDLVLNLTGIPHFQFEKLPTYKKLGCFSLKEMDFGFHWKNKFFFLEVKSFQRTSSEDFKNKLLNDLPAKAVHSFLMMTAVWSNTALGKQLINEGIPLECASSQALEMLFALDLPSEFESHLGALNTKINAILKDCLRFPASQPFVLMDYPTLCRRFSFIQQVSGD